MRRSRALAAAALAAAALAAMGCPMPPEPPEPPQNPQPDDGDPVAPNEPDKPAWPSVFAKSVTKVTLEVDYENGAEPITSADLGLTRPWDVFEANAQALFAGHPRTLVIPKQLSQMEALTLSGDENFTTTELLAVAASHFTTPHTETERAYYMLFVDGFFQDASGVRNNVLGISIGDTRSTFIFKRALGSAGYSVEQATVVHEFGHAVGLVANGIPVTSPHHDEAHPAHCTNADACVMYWAIEQSVSSAADLVTRLLVGDNKVLFDDACLNDARAAGGE